MTQKQNLNPAGIYTTPLGHVRRSGVGLASYQWGKGPQILKVATREMGGTDEIWEMDWDEEAPVGYHLHRVASETFWMRRGSAMFTVAGIKFRAEPGDIVHVPPYMPHALEIEPDTKFFSFFKNIGFDRIVMGRLALRTHLPEKMDDAAFMDDFNLHGDSFDCPVHPAQECANPRSLRRKGESLATFSGEKGTFHLKVAPWETNGENEVWEMTWKGGIDVPPHVHYHGTEAFVMTSGEAEFMVAGEKQIARPGDLVLVPPLTPHGMHILKENTTWMAFFRNVDFYGTSALRAKVLAEDPERLKDPEFQAYMNDTFDSHPLAMPGAE